jgi:hypothetical protein
MCFEMGAGTPSAGCKRAADESEAQFIFGYLLNLRVAAALLTLLGVATASAQDQIGFRIDLPIIWNNKPDSENRSGSVQSGPGRFTVCYSGILHRAMVSIPPGCVFVSLD